MRFLYLIFITLGALFTMTTLLDAQTPAKTVISGIVSDAVTGKPVSFVSIFFVNASTVVGASTDINGKYIIETTTPSGILRFSFLGYEQVDKKVVRGITQTINVRLSPNSIKLEGVVFTADKGKYSKKNNPAVELMQKVIDRKNKNRIENYDYYQYQKQEKIVVAIANISDSLERSKPLRKVNFLFESADTSKLTGNRYLPFYFGETLSKQYYRKNPIASKNYVEAKRNVEVSKFLDTESMDVIIYQIFGDVNIYDNTFFLLANRFISPLSPMSVNFYRFYITDTITVSGTPCYELYFTPQNALDFGFKGHIYITVDSSYAVKRVELRLTPDTQVNFVTDLLIEQEFEQLGDKWVLNEDISTVEFSLIGRTYLSFHGKRVNTYRNIEFDVPQPDYVYSGVGETVREKNYDQRDDEYWEENRLSPLTRNEAQVYQSYKRLDSVGWYKFVRDFTLAMVSGYVEAGPVDVGPLENMVSFNSIENVRLRIGGKTNGKFHRHLFLEGFLAYGTRDEKFKYNATAMYSFNRKKDHPWEFPINLLTVSCEYNTKIPGQGHLYGTGDRLFLSIGRGSTEKMTFERKFDVTYQKENRNNFRYTLNFAHLQQYPLGELSFKTYDGLTAMPYTTISFGIGLRLAPDERYVQLQKNRYPLSFESPVYELKYAMGVSGLFGREYTFHKIQASFIKRWYMSGYGFLDVSIGAGKIFNKVSFPSLFVVHANQDLAFQEEAFNMMRFFEFVTDQYVDLKLFYCFNGYLFNRIPLIKKLKWRELVTCKAIYGSVSTRNTPGPDNPGLMLFPHDSEGNPTTFGLGAQPFMEAGIGIDNIFSFLRVDLVKRLSYLDHPNIKEWSVRVQFRFSF